MSQRLNIMESFSKVTPKEENERNKEKDYLIITKIIHVLISSSDANYIQYACTVS